VSRLRSFVTRSLFVGLIAMPIVATAADRDPKAATSAAPKPAAKDDKKADEKGLKDAGAPDGSPGPVDGGEALPPGHPPVDEGLPPGHPQVDEDGDEEAHPDPHGGKNPRANFFEPPEDTAEDDATLPPGTLIITIADADGKPLANAPVVLGILKSSVAQGDKRDRRAFDTDALGTAKLEGLPVGAGVSYRVTTTRGAATYASSPFALSDKAGKRATVHAYEAVTEIEQALVGFRSFVFVSLREDALVVEQLFGVFNIGKLAWVPDAKGAFVGLPQGYKAWNKSEGMSDIQFVEENGKGAHLQGTIPPGQHEASFRFQVPLEGTERQTFHIELPPHVGDARVFSEANKSMGLEVAGFPDAQRQRGRDGRKVIVTARQASQGERGIQTLDITITGLPVPGPGRWIAVIFAIGALGVAAAYTVKLHKEGGVPEDARDDLLEAREALLGEFVALEKAKNQGDIGPKTYTRLRTALLDALARIEAKLDEVRAARRRERDRGEPKGRGEARGAGSPS